MKLIGEVNDVMGFHENAKQIMSVLHLELIRSHGSLRPLMNFQGKRSLEWANLINIQGE